MLFYQDCDNIIIQNWRKVKKEKIHHTVDFFLLEGGGAFLTKMTQKKPLFAVNRPVRGQHPFL